MNFIKLLRARIRLFFGVCPACNSDAPEVDTCKICNGITWRDTLGEPPNRWIKETWMSRYRAALAKEGGR